MCLKESVEPNASELRSPFSGFFVKLRGRASHAQRWARYDRCVYCKLWVSPAIVERGLALGLGLGLGLVSGVRVGLATGLVAEFTFLFWLLF